MKLKLMLSALLACASLGHVQADIGIQKATATYIIDDYAKTKYPIVFVHGMYGFNRLGSATFGLDYWYQILPDLAKHGATAFASQISPLHSNEVRGEQLLSQIEEVIAITGQPKVNLIGHSQGGPTARYILGTHPELLASIATVAGVHGGSPVADVFKDMPVMNSLIPVVMDALATPVINFSQQTHLPTDFNASLYSMSKTGYQEYNAKFPLGLPTQACSDGPAQVNGIALYSWVGMANTTNLLDPDTLLTALGPVVFDGQPNDGLVSRCSSKFGKTIRDDYAWNHFDEVNQVLGMKGLFAQDPVDIFRQHANRLKLQGL